MSKGLAVEKACACLRNWKTSVGGASRTGEIHVRDRTLKTHQSQIMPFLFGHVKGYRLYSK